MESFKSNKHKKQLISSREKVSSSLYLFEGKIQEKNTSYNERGKLKRERKKKQGLCLFEEKLEKKKDTRQIKKTQAENEREQAKGTK